MRYLSSVKRGDGRPPLAHARTHTPPSFYVGQLSVGGFQGGRCAFPPFIHLSLFFAHHVRRGSMGGERETLALKKPLTRIYPLPPLRAMHCRSRLASAALSSGPQDRRRFPFPLRSGLRDPSLSLSLRDIPDPVPACPFLSPLHLSSGRRLVSSATPTKRNIKTLDKPSATSSTNPPPQKH